MFIFCSLRFFKDWINVRLRLCYCCSALCLTLIQTWRTVVVTVLDSANAKFAIMSSCLVRVYRLVTHENKNAVLSIRHDRYCVSLIDTDQSRNTGKYYLYDS